MNIQSDVVTQIRGESENDDKNKYFFLRAYFILGTILVILYVVYTSVSSLTSVWLGGKVFEIGETPFSY